MSSSAPLVPVTVVVPTVGRPQELRACLKSLAAGRIRPAEVLVVDQSKDAAVAAVLDQEWDCGVVRVGLAVANVAQARNAGLETASHDIVLMTDDDCTVDPRWVAAAWEEMQASPHGIVTGFVRAAENNRLVPSTKESMAPEDFTGTRRCDVLYTGNAAMNRHMVLAMGGFDARFARCAEDNDLCYRWLKAGGVLRYTPDMVVVHHGARRPEELERLHAGYYFGQGQFYGKHLRARDPAVLRFLIRDIRDVLRAWAARILLRRERWTDPRRAILRALPAGICSGWRAGGADLHHPTADASASR